MSHKMVAVAAAGVLSLIVLENDKLAGAVELTDPQMDQITAGAFLVVSPPPAGGPAKSGGVHALAPNIIQNLTDINGNIYRFQSGTNDFLDNHDVVWWPVLINYYRSNVAVGVLYNPATGQTWNGGYPDPPSLGPSIRHVSVFF